MNGMLASVPSTLTRRAPRGVAALLAAAGALLGAGCGGPSEVRSVADFDAAPCLLFSAERMTQIVARPFSNLVGSEPKLSGDPTASSSEASHACTYTFVPAQATRVPPVANLTVTLEHAASGSQPLAVCVAGAATKTPGYKLHPIGEQACLSPTSDLWLKHGPHYFHVVLVPQPGFDNPVDMNLALSPMILAVGEAAAAHLPKS
jgi:hypothetical protein